jgi:hypothetical protein
MHLKERLTLKEITDNKTASLIDNRCPSGLDGSFKRWNTFCNSETANTVTQVSMTGSSVGVGRRGNTG